MERRAFFRFGSHRRQLVEVAGITLCAALSLSACSPADVLNVLGGCTQNDSSVVDASDTSASGEWTQLVGQNMQQVNGRWPQYTSFCQPYVAGFQCTWWACMRQKSLGHSITGHMGNGNQWGASAQALGWQEGAAVSGIISVAGNVNLGSWYTDPSYGHVAVIEQIDGDTLHYSEGGTGFGKVHAAKMSVSHPPAGVSFWHPTGATTIDANTELQPDTTSTGSTWQCASSSHETGGIDVSYDGDGTHATPEQAKAIAKQMMRAYKWDDYEFDALVWVWTHEPGWR